METRISRFPYQWTNLLRPRCSYQLLSTKSSPLQAPSDGKYILILQTHTSYNLTFPSSKSDPFANFPPSVPRSALEPPPYRRANRPPPPPRSSTSSNFSSPSPSSPLTDPTSTSTSTINKFSPSAKQAFAESLVDKTARSASSLRAKTHAEDMRDRLESLQRAREIRKQMSRRWKPGDVYSPHDLSPVEQTKWRRVKRTEHDVFDELAMDPLAQWKNVGIMTEYRSPAGRIFSRKETGLSAVNQRKVSKAIRRAVGMAWLPGVHHHPEVLEDRERRRNEKRFGLDGRRERMLRR